MQKLINLIALFAGLVAGANVALAGYLYFNRDYIFDSAKEKATEEITKAITKALPSMIDTAMPELPGVTGGPVDSKSGSGLPLPKF